MTDDLATLYSADAARDALLRYAEPVLRRVAGRLAKAKIGQTVEDAAEAAAATLTNPPAIDRRLKELPPGPRVLLNALGVSRQPRWTVDALMALAAGLGYPDGFAPVEALLEFGIAFPADKREVPDFATWYGTAGPKAAVFVPMTILDRASGGRQAPEGTQEQPGGPMLVPDGLEWPIRLAAAWQLVRATKPRLTQTNTLFKRDAGRVTADPVLGAPLADVGVVLPEGGVLAILWAKAAGLLSEFESELRPEAFPPAWKAGVWPTLTQLFSSFFAVDSWDPVRGQDLLPNVPCVTATAGLLAILHLPATGWTTAEAVAAELWDRHPHWPHQLSKEHQLNRGVLWVTAFLKGVLVPLRIADVAGESYRLADFGRHLVLGDKVPPAPPPFPQTLLVQPNAEVLVYRQGMTPELLGQLTRFAGWKQTGPACGFELNAEETYRGLEAGLSLAEITRLLDRHGMRPTPPSVTDLLRRWADKRDRVVVYGSATLVEFSTPADLDSAISRGIVAVRVTDRIGVSADGADPPFAELRLIGNRDYESRPQRCVAVANDGLTLTVDAAQSDLLLEAEIGRVADAQPNPDSSVRTYKLSPASLTRAVASGLSLADLDLWCESRTGERLSPAGRLFVTGPALKPSLAGTCVVVEFPTEETADGIMQWRETAGLIDRRLGPTAVVVNSEHLQLLRDALLSIGVAVEVV